MKRDEIKKLQSESIEKLNSMLKEEKSKLVRLRLEAATGRSGKRKDIARILTAISEIELSTRSTPRAKARGMLRVDTERRFLLRTKVRSLAPSNVSKEKE